jgi:hypothetical protein
MMDASPITNLSQHAREAFTRTEQVKAAAAQIASASAQPAPPPAPPAPAG